MEYQKYITSKKELSEKFHCFIENEDSLDEIYQNLISFINSENYQANSNEFKLILHMINRISSNHHRYPTFFNKIEKFFSSFSEYIKQSFTNFELLNIFQNNKRILHFLFKSNLIAVDESIAKLIMKKDERRHFFVRYFNYNNTGLTNESKSYFNKKQQAYKNTVYYFFPEIKRFLDEEKRREIEEQILSQGENIFDMFECNRQIGENDSYICKLIREDSIKEFCVYVNKNNLSLSIEIPDSIFETNPFLLKKRSSLIEYSAFFGSIQIFQYLLLNGVELTPSLWLYAIHGKNSEIIHLLEENHIKPEDESYFECLKESIKCHHNDIANYILLNLMQKENFGNGNYFENNQCAFGFHYHNYVFIQSSTNFRFIFYYACLYDYFEIVKLLINTNQIDLSYKVI